MSNNQNQVKTPATITPVQTVGTNGQIAPLTDMASPEIAGIYTAIGIIEARTKALSEAVAAGKDSESALLKYREKMTKERAASSLLDAMLKGHPELIEQEEKAIVEGTRKQVSVEILTLREQMRIISDRLNETATKYGAPVVTVKQRDGSRLGNVTTGNMDRIRELLESRGFVPQFILLDDNKHYEVRAGDHKGRHVSNIERDWV